MNTNILTKMSNCFLEQLLIFVITRLLFYSILSNNVRNDCKTGDIHLDL